MLILLPTRNDEQALEDLTRNLAFTPISVLLAGLYDTELVLQIPRFSISNKVDLRAPLEQVSVPLSSSFMRMKQFSVRILLIYVMSSLFSEAWNPRFIPAECQSHNGISRQHRKGQRSYT
jgi:serine protease inhibitor